MDTGAWVGLFVTAVVLFVVIATLVPRIREHRAEQAKSRYIDEFYEARDREAALEREAAREHEAPVRERERQGAPHTPQ